MMELADMKALARGSRFSVTEIEIIERRVNEAGLPTSLVPPIVGACDRSGETPWYVIDVLKNHIDWEAILAEGPQEERVLSDA